MLLTLPLGALPPDPPAIGETEMLLRHPLRVLSLDTPAAGDAVVTTR